MLAESTKLDVKPAGVLRRRSNDVLLAFTLPGKSWQFHCPDGTGMKSSAWLEPPVNASFALHHSGTMVDA